MPTWHYSLKGLDETRTAKAMLWDVPVSVKKLRDLAALLKGRSLDDAKRLLNDVIGNREPVPLRRYHGKQAHKKGLGGKWGWPAGRYPVKAAKYLLRLIENVENNAIDKGLDLDRVKVIHVGVHRGPILKRYMPRAFGRSSPKFRHLSHIEIVVGEM